MPFEVDQDRLVVRPCRWSAGICHQHVDTTSTFVRKANESHHIVFVSHISADSCDISPGFLMNLLGGLAGPLFVSGAKKNTRALACQLVGASVADALAGGCHQCHAIS